MKKRYKVILTIILSILIFPIIKQTNAVTLPVIDPEGDVILTDECGSQTYVYEPTIDIASLDKNDSYVLFSFYGTPIIDGSHGYNITILWDVNGYNTTQCVAGYIQGDGFINGSKTVYRYNETHIISETVQNNSAFVLGNTLYFPETTPYPKIRAGGSCDDAVGNAVRICWKLVGNEYVRDYGCVYCDSTCDPNCKVETEEVGYTNTFTRLTIITIILIGIKRWKKFGFRLKKIRI